MSVGGVMELGDLRADLGATLHGREVRRGRYPWSEMQPEGGFAFSAESELDAGVYGDVDYSFGGAVGASVGFLLGPNLVGLLGLTIRLDGPVPVIEREPPDNYDWLSVPDRFE